MNGDLMRTEITEQPHRVSALARREDITALGVDLRARLGGRDTTRVQLLARGACRNVAGYR